MAEIIPAIIAENFDELKEKIKLVEPYVCPEPGRGIKSVQIDVMDGVFAPNKNWNEPGELKNIETNLDIEVHLMVENPEEEIDKWLDSGVKRILVHYEALASEKLKAENEKLQLKVKSLLDKCDKRGIELGIVLNLETSIDVLDLFYVSGLMFHTVQLMSIAKIGYHGQPFDERVISKISALREKYPDVKISVDGGINPQNAKRIVEAGADILIVGSAIFNSPDIPETIKYLSKLKSNKIK